ncbi:hypothetical protein [Rubellimicrobium sp. CFH 75288]|uniref:hypothetical protein n=1 Tax=Rubellimicrobium sp. CFH 75288 TaxID=2697034 RepID=UPI001412E412|nr:hypothetical protein [Rubellimicrobium sp. CFH 75288]NAZ35962.1 hypothetical protein [Rubellimicrobium sp. CFH 75288]
MRSKLFAAGCAAVALWAGAATAQVPVERLLREVRDLGFTPVAVEAEDRTVRVDAIREALFVTLLYDRATGELLSHAVGRGADRVLVHAPVPPLHAPAHGLRRRGDEPGRHGRGRGWDDHPRDDRGRSWHDDHPHDRGPGRGRGWDDDPGEHGGRGRGRGRGRD